MYLYCPGAVSGPVMRHTYQNRGTYTVTVIARNKVSSQTDQAEVVVQSLIQGKSHYIMEGGHYLVGRGRCITDKAMKGGAVKSSKYFSYFFVDCLFLMVF